MRVFRTDADLMLVASLRRIALSVLLVSGAFTPYPAAAQNTPLPSPPVIGAKSYLVIDAHTGHEVASLKPDERLAPASLTKLMTAYVVFGALADSSISLDDEVTVSEKAWRTPGSRMFIEVGTKVRVEDLLLGMIVQSGNDASVALAEHVAGSESVFAQMMTQQAQALGMQSSQFRNSTGLPDDEHYTTARDMATVARAIVSKFPQFYEWYSVREYEYNGISQKNRNALLWRDESVDGMKTGMTDDAGYCLVSSAERNGMRLISVVLGTASSRARTDGSQALLNYGFRFYETRLLYRAGEKVADTRVWKAEKETTPLGVDHDLYITVPRGKFDDVESVLNMPAKIMAPVARGQTVAELNVRLGEDVLLNEPLKALDENPQGSLWKRTVDGIELLFE
ncbi:MAG: D-alanyl-D-alanine carboxypeptidase family protein [Woeseiaceae bacterium]|nr:D-alanyl-D-alanine carboxypeptidase family protein [Woeseiaceae bacterium]